MPKLVTPLALLVGTLIFAAFSTRELWNDGMLVFGDLTKFPSEASVYLDGIREAWSDRGLGGVFPSSAFSLLPTLLLIVTFGNETLAQQLHMTLWIPVAFFGMAYICRRFVETSWFLAAVGGAVYVATPVSIGLFVAGAGGLIWAYALAPLVIVGVEMVHRRGFAGLAWFALAAALVAVPSVELLTFGLLALLVWLPLSGQRDRLALAGAGALALAIVTALPSLAGRGGTRLSSELVEKMTVDFQFTYSEITPQMLARLAGNRGDPMAPLGYNSWESWTFAGYLPLAALVIGLALRRRGDFFPIRTTALGLVTAGLLVVIAYAAEAKPGVFEDFSPSFVFRNPEKLMILLAAALVPGAVYGLHRMFEVYPQHRGALTVGVVAGLLAYLGVYASPALTGHWGVATVRDSYRADPALEASAQYIDKAEPALEGRWRVVWLPFQHEDVLNLEWILPQWANEPVLERRDPEVVETTRLLQDALAESDMRRFHAIADRASVRYVVLRANPDAAPLRQALASDPDSKRVYSGRGFVIWRNTAALPRIRSFSALEAVATTDRERAVRYTSAPIVTLRPSALTDAGGWSAHPGENFSRVGPAIRIQATSSRLWPVLAQRIRVDGAATYVISAWVRTRNAADAHLKVIWYRRSGAQEVNALAHSYAQPRLSGNRGWTRVSGVVTSPAAATFAEVAFLAGRLREGSRRSAVTWVRDIRMVNRYVGDLPTTATDAVLDVSPDLAQPNHELVLAGSAAELSADDGATSVPVTPVVVNPTAGGAMPPALEPLVERRGVMQVAAAATVALQPQSGAWRRDLAAVEVSSDRGVGVIPLGRLKVGRYTISVTGCRVGSGDVRIVGGRTLQPRLTGPSGCGRWSTPAPVALSGRTAVRFSLPRDASIGVVQALPAQRRPSASTGSLEITGADTPKPNVSGLRSGGLTLADAYHPGWKTTGSGSEQFRALLGFNGFLVDEPAELSGLSFGPQLTRDFFLVLSALGWLAIAGLGFYFVYARRRWPRRYPSE